MARYLDIVVPENYYGATATTVYFNYPIRGEYSKRKDYFSDFVFGGARDQSVTGLSRERPELTVEYDLCGLRVGTIVLGSTIPQDTIPYVKVRINVDGEILSLEGAKVDTWELNWEEGGPARGVIGFVGTITGTDAPTAYNIDYTQPVVVLPDCTITLNGSRIKATRYNIRVNNNLLPLYYGNVTPQEVREQGMAIEGRVRFAEWEKAPSDGTIEITHSAFTITLPNIKWTEIPPRARGLEVPETECRFQAFPGPQGYAIKINYVGTQL